MGTKRNDHLAATRSNHELFGHRSRAGLHPFLCLAAPQFLNDSTPTELHHGVRDFSDGGSIQRPGELSACVPGRGQSEASPALPVDLTDGKTTLPNGKTVPIGLSELAAAQGFRWFYRAPAQKLPDVSMHRWLRGAVYNDKGLLELFSVSFIEGAV